MILRSKMFGFKTSTIFTRSLKQLYFRETVQATILVTITNNIITHLYDIRRTQLS